MITAVAKMKYGQSKSQFLMGHLPKMDETEKAAFDFSIKPDEKICEAGTLADDMENVFHFRYVGVPMSRVNGAGEKKDFTLTKLEVIGRITAEGLDIEVNISHLSRFLSSNDILWHP